MRLFFLLGLCWITLAQAQNSYVAPARTLTQGGTEYDFGIDFFQTTGIVDNDGEGFSLAEGSSYSFTDVKFTGKYGFTSEFEGMLGLRARMVNAAETLCTSSTTPCPAADEKDFTFARSGLESAIVGFKYAFPENDGIRYAFEGWYRQALHSNSEYDGGEPNEISLGDDTRELAIGLDFYYKTKDNNYFSGRMLYRDPSQTLSSEFFTQFEVAIAWRYFAFLVGVENNYSLENDEYSSDPENKPRVYNGPSYRHNSVNRSWTAPYAQAGIALGKSWRVEGRYTLVTTGNSTDLGPMISVNLVKREENSKEFKKRDSQFKQYTIEGSVVKISSKRSACVVDRGLTAGLKRGMRIDFYYFDYVDGNQLIATGVVVKAGASKSLVKIKRRYSKRRVDVGTVARAGQISN